MNINDNISKESNIIRILKGSFLALIISVVGLLILSLILAYTNVSENISTYAIMIIMGVSIIIGSFISSRKVKKNGLINGAIVGGIYIFIIYIGSSMLVTTFGVNIYTIIMFIIAILTGIIGGVIGVNM